MLSTRSHLGLDDPKDFGDLLLPIRKLVKLRKPDRERFSEVKQSRKICQRILGLIPQSYKGLIFFCDSLYTTICSECSILTHKSVKNGAFARATIANDDISLV